MIVSRIQVDRKIFLVSNFLFWCWNGVLSSSRCRKRLLECIFHSEPKANLEIVTREAFFYIERRKVPHFISRKENSDQKWFSVHENSTHYHECSFFSQLATLKPSILGKNNMRKNFNLLTFLLENLGTLSYFHIVYSWTLILGTEHCWPNFTLTMFFEKPRFKGHNNLLTFLSWVNIVQFLTNYSTNLLV